MITAAVNTGWQGYLSLEPDFFLSGARRQTFKPFETIVPVEAIREPLNVLAYGELNKRVSTTFDIYSVLAMQALRDGHSPKSVCYIGKSPSNIRPSMRDLQVGNIIYRSIEGKIYTKRINTV